MSRSWNPTVTRPLSARRTCHPDEHLHESADARIGDVRLEPRGERLALDRGGINCRQPRLEAGELELTVKRQGTRREQRRDPDGQRVPASAEEGTPPLAAGTAPWTVDPKRLQRLPQVAASVERVGARLKTKPCLSREAARPPSAMDLSSRTTSRSALATSVE